MMMCQGHTAGEDPRAICQFICRVILPEGRAAVLAWGKSVGSGVSGIAVGKKTGSPDSWLYSKGQRLR